MKLPEVRINLPPQIHRCEAGWSWSPPPLLDFDLWYVLDGIGELQLDNQNYPVRSNSCFVFMPGAKILARHDPRHRLRVFAAHFDWPNHRRFRLPAPGSPVRDAVFLAAMARRCETSYRLGTSLARSQSAALVGQMLLHLCAEAAQPSPTLSDARISAVVELIREDPGRRWTIAELAHAARLSRSQFTRSFSRTTGFPPERFLIHARIERATQLLRETQMSIGEIAEALGYCDVYHFSRQYRQITGKPASTLRARRPTPG